ncbi:MAG TPA: hypothetical protein VFQ53_15340 [Kofleriaceae bacterium]|nr:hypothetical protein [Kofleriaceae bacterium]
MSRSRTIASLALLLASLASGCVTADGDDQDCFGGKCDGGKDVCEVEHRYGNGTCDVDCTQADIDCFTMFDDQASAETWFAGFEQTQAMQENREPRKLIASTDPRFVHMQELLEQGWQSYRRNMPVGRLEKTPALIVIDDASVNAFVALDRPTMKIPWAVMVQTGALETGQPDYAILGVVMHELTHAVKLHVMPGVGDKIRIHYQLTGDGPEPFGYQMKDDPRAREAITAWRDLGEEAGSVAYAELNGMPVPGSLLSTMLTATLATADPAKCASTVTRVDALNVFLAEHTNPLTSMLVLASPEDRTQLDSLTKAFLTELRDVCLAGSTLDLFQMMAEQFSVTPEEIAAEFPVSEQQSVAGKHVIDQITILAADRHCRMRDIAILLQQDTGRDISTLRYFSTEEAADDASVPVLLDMGLPGDGVGVFFTSLLPESGRVPCQQLLDAGTNPPYGDLVDEHHGTCWRTAHVKALAAAKDSAYRSPRNVLAPAPSTGAYRAIAGERTRFHRASDDTSDALHRR